jgi:DNA-directed RNA polymerase subunit RPC12/RpoP
MGRAGPLQPLPILFLIVPMNVTYNCTGCGRSVREAISSDSTELKCPHCRQQIAIPDDAISGHQINRCLVCPSRELFARKDFPQRLGVALVISGFVASSYTWAYYHVFLTFAILFCTALIDLILYVVMGVSLTCYRCGAQYRGVEEIERHGGFNLETHERHRQLAARIKEQSTSTAKLPTG